MDDNSQNTLWASKSRDQTIKQAAEKAAGVRLSSIKSGHRLTRPEIFWQMVSQVSMTYGRLDGENLITLFDQFTTRLCQQVNCLEYDPSAPTTLTVDPILTFTNSGCEQVGDDGHSIEPRMLMQHCESLPESSPGQWAPLALGLDFSDMSRDQNSSTSQTMTTPIHARNAPPIPNRSVCGDGDTNCSDCCEPTQASGHPRTRHDHVDRPPPNRRKKKSAGTRWLSTASITPRGQRVGVSREPAVDKEKVQGRERRCKQVSRPEARQVKFANDLEIPGASKTPSVEVSSYVERMGDGNSLLELKRLIQQGRQMKWDHNPLAADARIGERLSRIKHRESQLLYLTLQQWIDVTLMYEECSRGYPYGSSQFAIEAPRPSTRSLIKRRGNPFVTTRSAIIDYILRQLRPDLEQSHPGWNRERDFVRKICQLGSRLAVMKARFDEGILCLALLACAESGLARDNM